MKRNDIPYFYASSSLMSKEVISLKIAERTVENLGQSLILVETISDEMRLEALPNAIDCYLISLLFSVDKPRHFFSLFILSRQIIFEKEHLFVSSMYSSLENRISSSKRQIVKQRENSS